jgi:hypothetical protein
MTEVSKSLSQSNKEYANNKTVVEAAKGSNEQLRARLSLLTKEYNGLSKEQRENSATGKQMQATIKGISDKLKENEKAVGDNRRNVGNYEEALKGVAGRINVMGVNLGGLASQLNTYKEGVVASAAATKASAAATGGLSGAMQILKVALIATGIGAFVVVLGSMVTFLTQTKRGSELLAQGLSAIGATVSVLTDRMSQLGEALTMVFSGEFTKAAEQAKGAFSGITEEIVKESQAAAGLEKRMQKLRDAERELLVEVSKRKAEVAELQLIAEDETNSYAVRAEAIKKANAIQEENMRSELELQKERVAIIAAQMDLSENLEEDEQRLAEERAKLGEIEAANIKKLRTLKAKENSIRKQEHAEYVKQENQKRKLTEDQIKAEQERLKAIEQGYVEERKFIDEAAELKKNQAITNIANAEEQAEAIRYIEKQALLDKIAVIDEETIAATAGADAIGAADQEKYAKQLAERAKYEAQIAMMDRAAKAEAFTRQVNLLNGEEQLEMQSAELSIDNAEQLEAEKLKISLKYAQLRLELMRKNAMLDGILSDEERQKLTEVENTIKRIQGIISNKTDGGGTLADMLGITDEQLTKIQTNLGAVTQALQAVQSLVSANAQARIQEIETQNQYEVQAVENSALSEEAKAEKIKQINRKAAEEKYKIEVEQFKVGKALSIALAIANTATAVVAQLSNPTPYAGFVLAALAAATGVVQIAAISAQKPPPPPQFASGGYVSGPGTGTSDSIDAKLSNGESVINAKSTAKYGPLLSAINADGGGVDWYKGKGVSGGFFGNAFAGGGIASPTFAARQATNSNTQGLEARIDQLGDRIEQMQPIVRVTDINRVNRQTLKVQQSADL